MAGKKADWDAVFARIKASFPERCFWSLREALGHCINVCNGSTRGASRIARVSDNNLRKMLDSLKIVYGYAYRETPPQDNETRYLDIDVRFDKEAWEEDGKRRSPCLFCSGQKLSKNNRTCPCEHAIDFDSRISGIPSHLNVDSIATTQNICTIWSCACGR